MEDGKWNSFEAERDRGVAEVGVAVGGGASRL